MRPVSLDSSALSALDDAPVWLNSAPLTAAQLRGRVVLVDFWTYTCVNWLRTLPYVQAWHERYRERGLVVVGVHAPEFGFEHDLGNVRRAIAELGVGFPVVIDNEFAIWRAFENHYWPAVYLVDGDGRIRFHHFGEEAYGETERTLQQLLGAEGDLVSVDAGGLAAAADWGALRSPETYLGSVRGERRTDAPADGLALNQWTLAGEWAAERRIRAPERGRRLDRLPVREPRPEPGARAAGRRRPGRLHRAPRRRAAWRCPRARRRRVRERHARRAAHVPARPPARVCAPADVRDRVRRARRPRRTSSRSGERRDFRRSGMGRRLST